MRGNWVSELPTEAFIPDKLKTALCLESDEAAGIGFLDLAIVRLSDTLNRLDTIFIRY